MISVFVGQVGVGTSAVGSRSQWYSAERFAEAGFTRSSRVGGGDDRTDAVADR